MATQRQRLFPIIISLTLALFVLNLITLPGTPVSAAPKATATPRNPVPTNTPAANCYKPQSVNAEISGYLEGYSGGKGGPYIEGKEVVYNFVTFQRINFSHKTEMYTAGSNRGNYVGVVYGFISNQNTATDYTLFRNQYETQFLHTSQPADAPIWANWAGLPGRKGIIQFNTAPDMTGVIPVQGNHAYLEMARGTTFVTGQNGRTIYFWTTGSAKSYIVNCLVNIGALVNDIRSGNGSPTFVGSTLPASWREQAALAAQAAAQDYNNRVIAGTG